MHVSTLGVPAPTRRRPALSRLVVAGAAAALASVVAFASSAHATLLESGVSVTAPTTVTVGDDVDVTIELDDAADLFAYSITLTIDPTLLAVDPDSLTGPDGGFTSIDLDGSTVTIVHTRLGTSPGLTGPVTLASLTFTALASGPATIAVPLVEQLDSETQSTTLSDAAEATTTIEPADDTSTPTPTPSTTPTPDLVDDGDSEAVGGTGSGTGTTGGALTATGANSGAIVAMVLAAIALIVSGTLALRRRRAVTR